MHFVVQRQRMVARAPVVADALVAVDDQRVDAELMQARGNRKSGLAAADNEHRGLAIVIGARLAQPVGPVLGAEIARAVGLGPDAECLFVSSEFFQCRDDRPGAQAGGIGRETDNAGAGSERSLECKQRFDGFGAGARDPARWRPLRGDVEVSRRGARECFAQRRGDGRAATHCLYRPRESQHVAPEAVGMEQVCSRVGVICLQRGFEARKPMLRVRRRVCLLSFGDVHHWLRVGWAFRSRHAGLSRASTSSPPANTKDVDGRDKPGHDVEAQCLSFDAELPASSFRGGPRHARHKRFPSCPALCRASTSSRSRSGKDVDGRDIGCESTPFFGRLCPAMTMRRSAFPSKTSQAFFAACSFRR